MRTESLTSPIITNNPKETSFDKSHIFDDLYEIIRNAQPYKKSDLIENIEKFQHKNKFNSFSIVLSHWIRNVIEYDNNAISTAQTYFSRVGLRLNNQFGEIDVRLLSEQDIQEGYDACLASIVSKQNADVVAQVLGQFHRFAVKKFGLPEVVIGKSKQSGLRVVRARYLTVGHLKDVSEWLRLVNLPPEWYLATRFALVVAWRCGLRLGEVCGLRPIDLEQSPERWMLIRPHAERRLKTEASRRKICLQQILTEDEYAFVTEVLQKVVAHPDRSIISSLIGWSVEPREISRLVSLAMRDSLGSEGWTFHHLRHIAANNLLLVALEATDLCERYTGWSAAKQQQVLLAFAPHANARQARFAGLSRFLGHARVQETFQSYLHILPEILADRRKQLILGGDRPILLALMKRGKHDLVKSATVSDGYSRVVAPRLSWLVEPKSGRIAKVAGNGPPKAPPLSFEARLRSLVTNLSKALVNVEANWDTEEAARLSELDVVRFERVVARCRELAEFRTKQKKRRFFDDNRQNAPENPLIPLMPTGEDAKEFRLFFEKLLKLSWMPSQSAEIKWLVGHVSASSDMNNTGVPFRNPPDLKRMRVALSLAGVSSKFLHVEYRVPTRAVADKWKDAVAQLTYSGMPKKTDRPKENKSGRPSKAKGNVRLIIARSESLTKTTGAVDRRRSSVGWRFAIYLLAALEPWASTEDEFWRLFRMSAQDKSEGQGKSQPKLGGPSGAV